MESQQFIDFFKKKIYWVSKSSGVLNDTFPIKLTSEIFSEFVIADSRTWKKRRWKKSEV